MVLEKLSGIVEYYDRKSYFFYFSIILAIAAAIEQYYNRGWISFFLTIITILMASATVYMSYIVPKICIDNSLAKITIGLFFRKTVLFREIENIHIHKSLYGFITTLKNGNELSFEFPRYEKKEERKKLLKALPKELVVNQKDIDIW